MNPLLPLTHVETATNELEIALTYIPECDAVAQELNSLLKRLAAVQEALEIEMIWQWRNLLGMAEKEIGGMEKHERSTKNK